MSKKSKRIKNHQNTEAQHRGSEEDPTNRHVYIEPGAKIDFVEDLRKKYETTQADDSTHKAKQLFWTKIAAFLLLVTAVFAGRQVQISQKTFNASERPYVGIDGIEVGHSWQEADGSVKSSPDPTKQAVNLIYRIHVKNFGPVPGTETVFDQQAFLDGTKLTGHKVPDAPSIIFPTQVVYFTGAIGSDHYGYVMKGTKILTIQVTVSYKSSEEYRNCQRFQYDKDQNGFLDLGKCTL